MRAWLAFWWFMTATALPGGAIGVTTQGPFPSEAACNHARAWVKAQANAPGKYPVQSSTCWSDR